jgi:hypothetical protein
VVWKKGRTEAANIVINEIGWYIKTKMVKETVSSGKN